MARRTTPRVYREVATGPSKSELNRFPVGRSPLDDYREATERGEAISCCATVSGSVIALVSGCGRPPGRPPGQRSSAIRGRRAPAGRRCVRVRSP